jgi:hypothetical protein
MLEPENQVCFLINFIDTKQQFISDFFIGIHLLDQCYQEDIQLNYLPTSSFNSVQCESHLMQKVGKYYLSIHTFEDNGGLIAISLSNNILPCILSRRS